MDKDLPLSGLRVADFTWVWAGPFATMRLAQLGAEVIRVETKERTCITRRIPPFADGVPGVNRSGYFNEYNQGKKSIFLNLKQPAALEAARRLVAKSDIVADNFAAGVMARMGLGYPALRQIKPDLIMISLSGYGAVGPESAYISYGPAQVAMSGLSELTGFPWSPPMQAGFSYGDPVGGLHGVCAILAALLHRERTGEGQFIDLAQLESLVAVIGEGLMEFVMNGTALARIGNHDPLMSPHGLFRSAGDDAWLSIAVDSNAEWARLCAAMARPDLVADPRFATGAARKANEPALDALITTWTVARSAESATETLQAAGVAAFAAMRNEDLATDPHLRARQFFAELEHPEVGVRQHGGVPWQFSETPCGACAAAPCAGADTEQVMTEILGYTADEVATLQAAGAFD